MTDGTMLARVMAYYGYVENNRYQKVKLLCPFHEDRNESMQADFERGKCKCFACDKSWDAAEFVAEQENITMIKALVKLSKILADKTLFDIKERKYEDRQTNEELLEVARNYFYCLNKIDWTDEKSLDKDMKESRDYMINRGFTAQTLNDAGARYSYHHGYPLIFPVLDNGEFLGWQERTTDPVIEQKRKYYNNYGFSKATMLAGTYHKRSLVIIVEGYMDMLKIKQFGITNVVAIFGWSISQEQLKKLKAQGITHVISALDNDKCGYKGTQVLKKHFKVTRWQYLRDVKDPGDFTQASFTKMLHKTKQKFEKEN